MTMIPNAFVGSLAGTGLAQATSSDIDKAKSESINHSRKHEAVERADEAAGIGKTHEDAQSGDRDADGRRIWEIGPDGQRRRATQQDREPPRSIDPTGEAGTQLDLSG